MRCTKAIRQPQITVLTLRPARPAPFASQIPDPERGLYYQDRDGNVHAVDGFEVPKPRGRQRQSKA